MTISKSPPVQERNAVEFDYDRGAMAVIVGCDGRAVPLYELVSALDACVDYDEVREHLPTLSYGQIAAGLLYMRQLAKQNTADQDFEAEDDSRIEGSPEFQRLLHESAHEAEDERVLDS